MALVGCRPSGRLWPLFVAQLAPVSCLLQRAPHPASHPFPQSLLHTAMLHYKPEVYKQLLAHTHFPEESPEEAAQRWRSVAVG